MASKATRRRIEAENRRLFDVARKNEGQSAPRKHHIVPSSYLDRWAENGHVRVTDINSGHTYVQSPAKAMRETDFYSLAEGEPAAELEHDPLEPVHEGVL